MELPPPQQPGIGYYSANLPPPRRSQPASIAAIATTAIVLGALGTLCGVINVISASVLLFFSSVAVAMSSSLQYQSTGLRVFALIQSVLITLMYGVLLIGGIGGVQARSWARVMLIRWAVLMLFWIPISTVAQAVLIALVPDQQINQQLTQPGMRGMPFNATTLKAMQIVGIVFGGAAQCILPPFILVFWRRPYVIAAFEAPKPSF